MVTARPGQIGHELGIQIARTVSAQGDELTVRLNPIEMGRIEVRLSFDDKGSLRAVVAAESPAALDMLRRDSVGLGRTLADAGIRSDARASASIAAPAAVTAASSASASQGQGHGSNGRGYPGAETSDEPIYRPLRTSGQVDLMA